MSQFNGTDVTAICEVLERNGLGEYQAIFEENEIDLESFSMMTRQDLQDLAITKKGPQMKLLKLVAEAAKQMKTSNGNATTTTTAPPPPTTTTTMTAEANERVTLGSSPWDVGYYQAGVSSSGGVGVALDEFGTPPGLVGGLAALRASDDVRVEAGQSQGGAVGSGVAAPVAAALGVAGGNADARLFVYGIPASAMNDTERMINFLRQHFGRFGALATLELTPGQAESPSCALVEFAAVDAAERCMREVSAGVPSGKIIVDGHALIIRYWQPRAPAAAPEPDYYAAPFVPALLHDAPLTRSAPADLHGASRGALVRPPLLASEPPGTPFDMLGFAPIMPDAVYMPAPVEPYGRKVTRGKRGGVRGRKAYRAPDGRNAMNGNDADDNALNDDDADDAAGDELGDGLIDNEADDYNSKKRRALCQLYDELLRRDAHCAPHHHPCSAMAAKRIFSECTGHSFEDVLHVPFFDVVKAIEQCPDLFSISYVPDGRAGIDEMKWRFRANGPVRKKLPMRHHSHGGPRAEPWM